MFAVHRKPGSVLDDHLSSSTVAYRVKRSSTCKRATLTQISLQQTGFTIALCRHKAL